MVFSLLPITAFAEPPATVPTVTDVSGAGYNVTEKYVLVFYFDEPITNDVVWTGTYNAWSTNVGDMIKFVALEGFSGWYVAEFEDVSSPCQGKIFQLMNDGSFNTSFRPADIEAWTNMAQPSTKTMSLATSASGETICTLPEKGVYIYEMTKFIYPVINGTPESAKETNHGYITINKTTALAGGTVTVTVTANEGYALKTLKYNDGTDHEITADAQGAYKFTMPASDVTVTATFETTEVTIEEIVTNDYGTSYYFKLNDKDTGATWNFDIYYTGSFESGKTYTYANMDVELSCMAMASSGGSGVGYTACNFTATLNQDGEFASIDATVTLKTGGVYHITYTAPVTVTTWSELKDAIAAADGDATTPATETTTIKLTQDLTAPATGGESITIPAGKDITLDLNGHVINANGGAFGVIKVETGGTLTVIDSTPTTEHKGYVDANGLWHLGEKSPLEEKETAKTVKGGVITGGKGNGNATSGTNGGGVYVYGTLNMKAGNIVGNKVTPSGDGVYNGMGGGVYVNNGTFTMSGGTITGNTADAGGVCVYDGTFTMSGGTISNNNISSLGGGVYNKDTFTMSGGEITGNTAAAAAGGVCNYGTFTMSGGEITGNDAPVGGGVYNIGTFTMTDGEVSGNKANGYGGGVYVYKDGTFTMTDGAVSGNEAAMYGGGVYNGGTFTMTGGEITGNNAKTGYNNTIFGGGVCTNGTTFIGGTAKITGNTKGSESKTTNNLELVSGTVTLGTGTNTGAGQNGVPVPADGMSVGVTMATPGTFTGTATETQKGYFTSDSADYFVNFKTDHLELKEVTSVSDWSALQDAIDNATEPTTIKLTQDLTAPEQDGKSITIPNGKDITLDLNGKVLNADSKFGVITVKAGGKLTLIDSDTKTEHYFNVDATTGLWTLTGAKTETTKTVNGGVITGGNDTNSGGVFVEQGSPAGKLTMKGGNIVGNTSNTAGGGVYLQTGSAFDMEGGSIIGNITGTTYTGGGVGLTSASFTMTGGKIEYNVAASGGGVYSDKGTFTMTDGEIDNNTATGFGLGGGVGIGNGTFTMTGGKISGNKATTNGGGVYYNTGTVTLGGTAKITGNTAGTDGTTNNLYLLKDKTVTLGTKTASSDGNGVAEPVTGENGMQIGVTTQTAPTTQAPVTITTNGAEAQKACFTPDNSGYEVAFNNDHLELKEIPGITTWSALQTAIDEATEPTTIKLTGDLTAPATGGESITIPEGKDITLDLNGHVINANGGTFSVIEVKTGGKLTLIDSAPTTEHYFNVDATTGLWTLTNTQTDKTETVKGGVITGGTGVDCGKDMGTNGGGVYVCGTFNMKAGNIVGNKVTSSEDGYANGLGGGVSVYEGAFTMSGGTITGNTADNGGGGVCVYTTGTFTMKNGTISENTAYCGGGVYNVGTFEMNDGSITGNKATQFGGGIQNSGTLKLLAAEGKTITITGNEAAIAEGGIANWGALSLSGKVIIKDNICTGKYGDVAYPVNLATGTAITINGALTGSEIHITHASGDSDEHDIGVLTSGFTTNNSGAKLGEFFTYEGPSSFEMVLNEDGELEVKAAVKPVKVIDGKIKSGDTVIEVKDENGNEVAPEKLQEVAKAINEVLDNETVKEFDETGLKKATELSDNEIVAALKAKTDDDTAKNNVDETGISKYLNVTLVSAGVGIKQEQDGTVTVTEMVFDVTPMATITVTGSNGEVTLTTEITDDEIRGTVTFLLPVDDSIEAATAAVYHEGEFLGNYEIKADKNGKYIEVKTDSFSEFGYITLDETTAGAKIGTTLYASLSDAVSKVENDETIKLLKYASDMVTVSREVSFKIDSNSHKNNATIVAGRGYTVIHIGNRYTVMKAVIREERKRAEHIVVLSGYDTERNETNPETGAPVMNFGAIAVILGAAFLLSKKH